MVFHHPRDMLFCIGLPSIKWLMIYCLWREKTWSFNTCHGKQIYKILEANHEGSCGGHYAFKIDLHKILMMEGYVWPSIQKDVQHWCKSCKACQAIRCQILKLGLHQTIIAYDVFEKWGFDEVGPLPTTQRGKCYILKAVDYLSRWTKPKVVK